MVTQHDAIAISLAGRHYLYRLMQRVFGDAPSVALLEAAISEHTREALDLFLDDDVQLLDELRADETVLDALSDEYTRLFIGPGKLPAPPWESVYVTKERLIFQESTLNVRRAYLAYQFLPEKYPHEADDHIALELDFMAHLAQMSQECFETDDEAGLVKLLADQQSFLTEHLLKWVPDFAEQIQASKTHHFYPQMAALTAQFLSVDSALLDELLSVLDNKEER